MFSKVGFSISIIFLHLIQVYVIYCFVLSQNKKHPEPHKVHNPCLGKFYWFYNKAVEYNGAEKICLQNNQKIVQLPTQQEQIWVNEHVLGQLGCFWTGLKMYEFMNWKWNVIHGSIQNHVSRWNNNIIPLLPEKEKAYALGQHLYASNGSDSCRVVCQREYSTRQTKFSQLFGKQSLGRLLKTIPASVFQCASICMATADCTTLTVNTQRKMCMFFDSNISNISIDCSLEGTTCFIQN